MYVYLLDAIIPDRFLGLELVEIAEGLDHCLNRRLWRLRGISRPSALRWGTCCQINRLTSLDSIAIELRMVDVSLRLD